MEKRKKKSITKSLIASLGLASVLLAGIMVPLSCSEEPQTQNQPGGNGNNPGGGGGNNNGGGGNTDPTPEPQESKFKQPAEMLNQDGEKSKQLFSQYVDALERESLPTYPTPTPSYQSENYGDIPSVPAINPVDVPTQPQQTVTTDPFVDEFMAMLETGLDAGTTQSESAGLDESVSALITEMRTKTESFKETVAQDEQTQAPSVWSNYFDLVPSATTPAAM